MTDGQNPLPKPNVDGGVEGDVRAILCNPVYAGLAGYPPIVDDETWVRAAAKAMQEEGTEQWLVNMLHVLRASLGRVEV